MPKQPLIVCIINFYSYFLNGCKNLCKPSWKPHMFISTFARWGFIEETHDSFWGAILRQTISDIRILLADDQSIDTTSRIWKSWKWLTVRLRSIRLSHPSRLKGTTCWGNSNNLRFWIFRSVTSQTFQLRCSGWLKVCIWLQIAPASTILRSNDTVNQGVP